MTRQSVNTASYYLQRATNLAAANPFTTIATNFAGQPATTSYKDNALGSSTAFYRVYVR